MKGFAAQGQSNKLVGLLMYVLYKNIPDRDQSDDLLIIRSVTMTWEQALYVEKRRFLDYHR